MVKDGWDGSTSTWSYTLASLPRMGWFLLEIIGPALAVCFLYSFVDPTHERLVEAEIRARWPNLFVALSADVSPEFREYERL